MGVGFDGVISSPDSFIDSVLVGLDDDVIVRLVDDVIVGLVDDVIVEDNIRSSSSSSSFRLSGFNSDADIPESVPLNGVKSACVYENECVYLKYIFLNKSRLDSEKFLEI